MYNSNKKIEMEEKIIDPVPSAVSQNQVKTLLEK